MRVPVTQEYYDKIVDAFRLDPGNYTAAAKRAKISRNTSKRAWHKGWPEKGFNPIKLIIELEKLEARKDRAESEQARLEELKADAPVTEAAMRAKARRDAIRARADEGIMVAAARQAAINLLQTSKKMSAAIDELAPRVADALKNLELDNPGLKDIDAVGRILWRLSISTRAGAATAFQILQAERLLLGQPTDIIGLQDTDKMEEAEAFRELEKTAAAFVRMSKRAQMKALLSSGQELVLEGNKLRVIEGGKKTG